MQKSLSIGLLGLVIFFPQLAMGRDASFSNEQVMLNNQAVEATQAGNFPKAEQLFKAMLQIGEFNVVWMNLGRTYASQNKCIEAFDAFDHVERSPKIREIPATLISERLKEYRAELEKQCSARITLDCAPAEMFVTIDGGDEFKCSTEPLNLTPGQHRVHGRTDFGFNTVGFNAAADSEETVRIEVINFEKIAVDAGLTPEERARQSKMYKAIGWPLFGVGLGMVVGGGTWTYLIHKRYKSKLADNQHNRGCDMECISAEKALAEKKVMISWPILGVGAGLFVAGTALIIADVVKFGGDDYGLTGFSPVFTPEWQGLSLSGRF